MTATAIKSKPINFSREEVQAVLAGRKTQKRIAMEPQPQPYEDGPTPGMLWNGFQGGPVWMSKYYPLGQTGDNLWVREAWRTFERPCDMVDGILFASDGEFVPIENTREAADLWVDAHDNRRHGSSWRPPLAMPRWASRIMLELTAVRVERLQEITEADAQAEGVERPILSSEFIGDIRVHPMTGHYRDGFRKFWDKHSKPGFLWESNPWVWVISFKRVSNPVEH